MEREKQFFNQEKSDVVPKIGKLIEQLEKQLYELENNSYAVKTWLSLSSGYNEILDHGKSYSNALGDERREIYSEMEKVVEGIEDHPDIELFDKLTHLKQLLISAKREEEEDL